MTTKTCKICKKSEPEVQFRMNKDKPNKKCNDCILKSRLEKEDPAQPITIRYSDYQGDLDPEKIYEMLQIRTKRILKANKIRIVDICQAIIDKTGKKVSYSVVRTLPDKTSLSRNLAGILAEFLDVDVHRIKLNPFFQNNQHTKQKPIKNPDDSYYFGKKRKMTALTAWRMTA